jgi:RND superfamily putative drug exporter
VVASVPIFSQARSGPKSEVALIVVYPTTSPQAAATTNLVYHLRDDVIPKAEGTSGAKVLVGGDTAIFVDFAHVLSAKLPLFIGWWCCCRSYCCRSCSGAW